MASGATNSTGSDGPEVGGSAPFVKTGVPFVGCRALTVALDKFDIVGETTVELQFSEPPNAA